MPCTHVSHRSARIMSEETKECRIKANLTIGQAGRLHIDGGEQVLEEGGGQLEVLLGREIVHDHEW